MTGNYIRGRAQWTTQWTQKLGNKNIFYLHNFMSLIICSLYYYFFYENHQKTFLIIFDGSDDQPYSHIMQMSEKQILSPLFLFIEKTQFRTFSSALNSQQSQTVTSEFTQEQNNCLSQRFERNSAHQKTSKVFKGRRRKDTS